MSWFDRPTEIKEAVINVVVNISYQTVNSQETFKNFLEMF